uniref:Uncharacterized protein n=1 Tax=Arundo donax TaxID=35708 RepID=A0A0A9ABP5_ARUDO
MPTQLQSIYGPVFPFH